MPDCRIDSLIDRLLRTSLDASLVFNPWRDVAPDDLPDGRSPERRERLRLHLEGDPLLLLVGEAPGWRGCRISGIPFVSELQLRSGAVPRVPGGLRLSGRPLPLAESSATIVWDALLDCGVAERTALWNAFPFHPHPEGRPFANRAPTAAELKAGLPFLAEVVALFPRAAPIAIGRHAAAALARLGVPAPALRHPAFGGATAFRTGLRDALAARGLLAEAPRLL